MREQPQNILKRKSLKQLESQVLKQHLEANKTITLPPSTSTKPIKAKLSGALLVEAYPPSFAENLIRDIQKYPSASTTLNKSGLNDLQLLREPQFLTQANLGQISVEVEGADFYKRMPENVHRVTVWQSNFSDSVSFVYAFFEISEEKQDVSEYCNIDIADKLEKVDILAKYKSNYVSWLPKWWRPRRYRVSIHSISGTLIKHNQFMENIAEILSPASKWFRSNFHGQFNALGEKNGIIIPIYGVTKASPFLQSNNNLKGTPFSADRQIWTSPADKLSICFEFLGDEAKYPISIVEKSRKNLGLTSSDQSTWGSCPDYAALDRLLFSLNLVMADALVQKTYSLLVGVRDHRETFSFKSHFGWFTKKYANFFKFESLDCGVIASEFIAVSQDYDRKKNKYRSPFSRSVESNSIWFDDFGFEYLNAKSKKLHGAHKVITESLENRTQYLLTVSNSRLQLVILAISLLALFKSFYR
jgi:hypothetical protein